MEYFCTKQNWTAKVKAKNLTQLSSIAKVVKHIVGEHVMKAYAAIRGVYQVFVYLEGIMESVHFICHQELLREREENKTRTVLIPLRVEIRW